jgi:decaprenyl-phosphate phosphoribosyltransferase
VLTHHAALLRSITAFALFTGVAAATYFFNDAFDRDSDRLHPLKRHRPLAAGTLPLGAGLATGGALLLVALGASVLLTWRLTLVLVIYVAVQAAYSVHLKRVPVYDLVCIAAGFVLRGIAGAVAVHVPISEWFLLVTMFGSLLMVTGKRLAEQAELGAEAGAHRATLGLYSSTFLRTVLGIAAGGAIIGYCLWAFALQTALAHHHDPIWYQLSIAPILIALLRYTYLVEQGRASRPEDLVLGDRSMIGLGLLWATMFGLGVYAS